MDEGYCIANVRIVKHRRFSIFFTLLAVVAAFATWRGWGQTQTPTIKANVRQVLVPTIVTDKSGHYVTGLKASDFEVFENGTLQHIVAFGTATQPVGAAGQAVDSLGARPTSTAALKTRISPAAAQRTYLVCVDTLHSAFANFANVRDALKKFFQQEQSEDSQYALMALGRDVRLIQDSTTEPAKMLAAIEDKRFLKTIQDTEAASIAMDVQRFTNFMRNDYCVNCACEASGATVDGPACAGAKDRARSSLLNSGERMSVLNQNFLRALNEIVRATASMPTTRTIIFISDGFNRFPGRELYAIMDGFAPKDRSFDFNPRDTRNPLEAVLKLALRYDVKFYTLDSRGLYGPGSLNGNSFDASSGGPAPEKVDLNAMTVAHENTDALAELARETGGIFFENNNDLLKGIRRAFADGREYYVLAYVPENTAMDGAFRKIKVEMRNKKLRVNAKAGYWATEQ